MPFLKMGMLGKNIQNAESTKKSSEKRKKNESAIMGQILKEYWENPRCMSTFKVRQ